MRMFVAVEITDPGALEGIRRAQEWLGDAGRAVPLPNLHFTLRFLGEMDEKQVADMAAFVENMKVEPFPVILQGMGAFGGRRPRVIWVGTDVVGGQALAALAGRVNDSLPSRPDRPFRPHLTIMRNPRRIIDVRDHMDTVWGRQHISVVKLKRSILAGGGASYTDVAASGP